MRNKMMFQRKRHLTFVTPIRPLSRMQQQMRVETVLPRERFPTMRAHMRPFTYETLILKKNYYYYLLPVRV